MSPLLPQIMIQRGKMLRNRSHLSDHHGFTLVELLVAVTIFAIGLLTVAGMQLSALRANMTAEEISIATALAEGALEELLARDPADPIFDTTMAGYESYSGIDTSTLRGGDKFAVQYRIEADNPTADLARVTVEVGYRNRKNADRQISMTGFKREI